jgi:hypothetical protein
MAAKRKPLAEAFPHLAKEAHGWDPTEIHDLTNQKMGWICSKGHTWLAFTYTRTGKNARGCPVCANKTVSVGSNDLKSKFPELAKEADGWDPATLSVGTHKKVSWKCKKNHQWSASVANRVNGRGCPYCSNNKLLAGFNDLATIYPEVAAEADGWDPRTVLSGSTKKLSWKCKKGHRWDALVYSRTGKTKTGCPYCWGRLVIEGETDLATLFPEIAAEAHGWDPRTVNSGSTSKAEFRCNKGHIYKTKIASRTSRGVGCSVCANKVIVPGINDLATTHPEVALEADGWDPTKVVAGNNRHFDWKCEKGHQWNATLNHRTGRNQGCPYCSGFRILVGVNDLRTTHPHVASEADGWDPKDFSAGSNVKVWWKCSLGHKWETTIAHRTGKLKTGCPICVNYKVETGFNDLASKFPHLALQADGWDPTEVGAGSNKKMSWKCDLGHKWDANVSSRSGQGTGCPVCANLQVQTGFNDLATTHPEIAKEAFGWDPKMVTHGFTSKKEWKCSNGHTYFAPPIRRTTRNTGCSICANKILLVGFNDLATTHPGLAKEAYGWDPTEVNAGQGSQTSRKLNLKRKWKCSLGHIYEATPASRTNTHHQSGCPICAGNLLLVGFNDLATTHPELAKEAFGWDPKSFVAGGKEKKKWKCLAEGHVWKVSISERKSGRGCPSCAQSGFDPNKDGWLYFLSHPDWEMLQIGITNVPDDRLATHKRLGWTVVELRGPMKGDLTRQWETDILRMLRAKKAVVGDTSIAGKFTGYTESWLEKTFPAKSLKELMNEVRFFEDKK